MKTLGEQAAEKFPSWWLTSKERTQAAQIIDTLHAQQQQTCRFGHVIHQTDTHAQQPCGGCEKLREAATGMLNNYLQLKRLSLQLARSDNAGWAPTLTEEDDIHVIAVRKALAQPCQQPASVGSELQDAVKHLESAEKALAPYAGNEIDGGGWPRGVMHCVLVAKDRINATLRRQSAPTPTVAKIAAEVAADLEDYIKIDALHFNPTISYRTADAQEMIERAFAGLEKENQRARQLLEEADRDIAQRTKLQLRTDQEVKKLQAELEQAKIDLGNEMAKVVFVQTRLATAEADMKRLDWLESLLPPEQADKARKFTIICLHPTLRECFDTARAAIDQAKGA